MIELLVQIAVTKSVVSLLLALTAVTVQRVFKRAALTHLIWLVVIITMMMPSVWALPLWTDSGLGASGHAFKQFLFRNGQAPGEIPATFMAAGVIGNTLVAIWFLVSAALLFYSLLRIQRFNRTLRTVTVDAPTELRRMALRVSNQIGLRRTPDIRMINATISPLVWWAGGTVRIVLPTTLVQTLSPREIELILAHELTHVHRKDHLVRWIEWVACIVFWWNPITWYARRQLREAEELCCDAAVLRASSADRKTYAHSLITVADFLSDLRGMHAPALAMHAVSAKTAALQDRLRAIVTQDHRLAMPRWSRNTIQCFAILLLPVGLLQPFGERAPGNALSTHESCNALVASVAADTTNMEGRLLRAKATCDAEKPVADRAARRFRDRDLGSTQIRAHNSR